MRVLHFREIIYMWTKKIFVIGRFVLKARIQQCLTLDVGVKRKAEFSTFLVGHTTMESNESSCCAVSMCVNSSEYFFRISSLTNEEINSQSVLCERFYCFL